MRLLCLALLITTSIAVGRAETIDFATQIAPLLQEHCLRCHSPNNDKGGLSLATIDQLTDQQFIVPGDPDASYLVELITPVDGEAPAMPQESEPLSNTQRELIRQWIAEGAAWPEGYVVRETSQADAAWWAFQPLSDSPPFNSIDAFIDARLAEADLQRNPPADRRILIRRATYDLLGLPPTPAEVEAFVNDPDPMAYERLIDRLLESPHYGERWGRHWLDVVRFGESIGYERNVIINNIWPFRDYVIRSLNEDKPFDQFIREHVAGDVFASDDPEVAVGSAFLVAGPYDDVGNQDPVQAAQIRANTLDEIINATGQAFLGLTIGCARCHDHKFDPITQNDYYQLYATFAGVRHGAVPLATPEEEAARARQLQPLQAEKETLQKQLSDLQGEILARARGRLSEYETHWTRPPVDRTGTEETFDPVNARFVRLICESQDGNPASASGFRIDEFEVWSASTDAPPTNVALAANGARATGRARQIEDFPGAYGPQLAIDGKSGARFIATGSDLTIELAEITPIDHVVFSSARGESNPEHGKFVFVADYRIEVSEDGNAWQEVAHGRDRQPVSDAHRDHRLRKLEITDDERATRADLTKGIQEVDRKIRQVPALPQVWIGSRNPQDAKGPFHVFLGGSPQKQGEMVVPASLSVFAAPAAAPPDQSANSLTYQVAPGTPEAERRLALAEFLTHPDNPLTPRVLANRVWHYHFGSGIVDTPSDFGYMGGRPTHPQLLDFLARRLQQFDWRLKPLHRLIMTSQTYRQASSFREEADQIDGDARLLWRFPPRRLAAEEIRDTILDVAGKLERIPTRTQESNATTSNQLVPDGGPGFRLYHFMQDNVCTYVPLDEHGPETYRRAVYHQNARASVVDLMTDFDQPDCTFSAPRRAETTTPLQALTMLNHHFTIDMAAALADRLHKEAGDDLTAQLQRAYQLCYQRSASEAELQSCREMVDSHGLPALCRVLLNTSELIYVQ